MNEDDRKVVVIGGGIAGIQSALDSADFGNKVVIVEKTTSLGGRMAALDKTFPTNDCSTCILSPKMVLVASHPNIEIITNGKVEDITGERGNFKVRVRKIANYIQMQKCVGCGKCAEKCPKKVPNEFNFGMSMRKAIYVRFPQAVPLKYSIDRENCLYFKTGKCQVCLQVCPTKAPFFEDKDEIIEINAHSIIIAEGGEIYKPKNPSYGVDLPNVITAAQFERMLSASGPTSGELIRMSDGKKAKKIAFIHCVGSRDRKNGVEYCSSVCCMHGMKEAMIAKEHSEDIECTMFYIDIRSYGKDFERYYERAKNEKIKFVKCRVSRIDENEEHDVVITYEDCGKIVEEKFDLAVLLTAVLPPNELPKNIVKNEYGFVKTDLDNPVSTSIEGIYVCGTASSPKDIPDTVSEASAAACMATYIHDDDVEDYENIEEVISHEEIYRKPRVGVFVCHCGTNIAGVIDVEAVAKYAERLSNVVHSEHIMYACGPDGLDRIRNVIREKKINRVVVASCTPRTHEQIFQKALQDAGINKYLFEFSNIREQCSWVHMNDKKKATEKAKLILRTSVAKASKIEPLKVKKIGIMKKVLVIGGGLSGMISALALADKGFYAYIVEKEEELGGNLRNIIYIEDKRKCDEILKKLTLAVEKNNMIKVIKGAKIIKSEGYAGNFRTTIKSKDYEEVIEHGLVIIAIGGTEHIPSKFMYGKRKNVHTLLEFEKKLENGDIEGEDFCIILCAESRDERRNYCSRVCCTHSCEIATRILQKKPNSRVYLLYRDIRAYSFKEKKFENARKRGAIFMKYVPDSVVIVSKNNDEKLIVRFHEKMLDEQIEIHADHIILATGIDPPDDAKEISRIYKLPLTSDGFFLEAHMKLRPSEFSTEGIYLCGLCHSPKSIDECIAQALSACMKCLILLKKGYLITEPYISEIDNEKCTACLICARACPYSAIDTSDDKVRVIDALCKGCGICVSACPSGAIQQRNFKDVQIVDMLRKRFGEWYEV